MLLVYCLFGLVSEVLTFISLSLLSKLREVDGIFVTHDCVRVAAKFQSQ